MLSTNNSRKNSVTRFFKFPLKDKYKCKRWIIEDKSGSQTHTAGYAVINYYYGQCKSNHKFTTTCIKGMNTIVLMGRTQQKYTFYIQQRNTSSSTDHLDHEFNY